MDDRTLAAYDRDAAAFAREWREQPAPSDMYDLLRQLFRPGPTADIGCGSGRDTAWLNENGFSTIGYDASEGLLAEAGRSHPGLRFQQAALPSLAGVTDENFANVLCETVIMHLPPSMIEPSVQRLLSILQPNGILYLSWRVTPGEDRRDEQGRLYAAFDPALVLQGHGTADILFDHQTDSRSSGKLVRRIIARKAAD